MNMESVSEESIASRSSKLNQLVLRKQDDILPNSYLASRDSLLDALFVLYDECNHDYMRKDHNVSFFVDKFRSMMSELKKLRVNKSDFEVKKVIGRGHFGEVQVVREKITGTIYAMKILRKKETLSLRNVAFYEEERDIMAKAESPWLTRLHYAFQDALNLYLVMEFHPGGDMLSLLSRYDERFPEEMARFYLAELVQAIHSLHCMNYVHRDIKPDNLLIDRTGHIKLADFGSAALLNADKTVTSGMPVGTPDYIAPEVLMAMEGGRGNKNRYGVECDWWSLGIVAYEMLFGATPFSEDTVLQTYNNIMNFKKTLAFPEGEGSDNAINLIRGLIQDAAGRMRYEQLLQHSFFAEVDWDSLRQQVPPFMPVVSGQDDTSNFDELEHEVSRRGDITYDKKEFSGKNLPFVGFTYTTTLTSSADANTTQELLRLQSPIHTCSINVGNGTYEVAELNEKLKTMNETSVSLQQRIVNLQTRLKEKSDLCATLLEERRSMDESIASLKRELVNNKKLFMTEKKQGEENEKKAMNLVKDIRTKYKNKEEEFKSQLALKEERVSCLENHVKSMQHENEKLKEKLQRAENEREEIDSKLLDLYNELYKQTELSKAHIDKLMAAHHEEISSQRTAHKHVIETMNQEFQAALEQKITEINALKAQIARQAEEFQMCSPNQEAENELEEKRQMITQMKTTMYCQEEKHRTAIQIKESEILDIKRQLLQVENEREQSEKSLQELTTQLTNANNANDKLLKDLQNMQEKEEEQAEIIKALKAKIEKQEEVMKNYEVVIEDFKARGPPEEQEDGDKGEVELLNEVDVDVQQQGDQEEQMECLKAELSLLKVKLSSRATKIQDMERSLRKKESELTTTQVDLRIAKREVKQMKDLVDMLKSTNRELRQKSSESQKLLSEAEDKENALRLQLKHAEEAFEAHKKQVVEEITQLKKENEELRSCEDDLETCHKELAEFRTKETWWTEHNNTLKQLCETLKAEISSLKDVKVGLEQEIAQYISAAKEKEVECRKLEQRFNTLKAASSEMDQQLEDYVVQLKRLQEEKAALKEQLESSGKQVEMLEEDLKDVTSMLMLERKKIEDLQQEAEESKEERDSQFALMQSQIKSLEDEIEQLRGLIDELTDRNGDLEDNLSAKNALVAQLDLQCSNLKDESLMLKEEAGKHLTQLLSVKSSNRKLCQALEDSMDKNKKLEKQVENLQNLMERTNESNESTRIKMEQTIAQQSKLIDFLQTKVEGSEKKKRPMQKLFGSKNKDATTVGIPLQFKELQELLEKEKAKNRRLQEKLDRSNTEVMACHAELRRMSSRGSSISSGSIGKQLINKPTTTFYDKEEAVPIWEPPSEDGALIIPRKDSGAQRIQHNIPHRFHETLCMRPTKCAACLGSIHFGRYASKCQECSTMCHTKCSQSLGNSCGLPSAYLQHFSDCVSRSSDETDGSPSPTVSTEQHDDNSEDIILEGWVKILRTTKNMWDRRFARIQGTKLQVYRTDSARNTPKSSLCLELDLKCRDGEVVITSAVPSTELLETSKTDLPYVLKVEPRSEPKRVLYMMTATFEEKKMWVTALESTVNKFVKDASSTDLRLSENRILKLEGSEKLDINCAYLLADNVLLLGAKEGLFLVMDPMTKYNASQPKHVSCVSSVYQIGVVKSADLVVLIEDRKLRMAKYSALCRQSQGPSGGDDSTLQLRPVGNVRECHLFSLSEHNAYQTIFLFAAGEREICLLSWNAKEEVFILVKKCQTNQPCSCVQFTREIAIFGSDRFYELDLRYFTVEEFLEPTDSDLAFFIYGAEQNQVLPVGVFPVSQPGEEEEYLLCFSNAGVFVDGNGRYTRGHLKWTGLPLAFAYYAHNLLVVHNQSLEVMPLFPEDNLHNAAPSVVFKLAKPRYLGTCSPTGGVFLASVQDKAIEVYHVVGNFLDHSPKITNSSSPPHGDGRNEDSGSNDSRFSFTSSLVNILESSLSS